MITRIIVTGTDTGVGTAAFSAALVVAHHPCENANDAQVYEGLRSRAQG
jgi:dethiobiotin synthetase